MVEGLLDNADTGQDLRDEAALAVSEVVTNALLHGAPPVSFTATINEGRLRVEVSDTSTSRGAPQPASATASRGRGLAIVNTLTELWGVEAQSNGKSVWLEFVLRSDDDQGIEVHLLGVPVAMYIEAQEQLEGAIHEIELLALEGEDEFVELRDTVIVPLRRAMRVFRRARTEGRSAAEAARSAGSETVDLLWRLPAEASHAARVWVDGVAGIVAAADAGLLMLAPPPSDIRALRAWLSDQVINQVAGLPPEPFTPATNIAS